MLGNVVHIAWPECVGAFFVLFVDFGVMEVEVKHSRCEGRALTTHSGYAFCVLARHR